MSLAAWTWSCLRPYRGRVSILVTIAIINVGLGVLAPWPLKLVVDNVLEGRPLPGVLDRIGIALAGDSRAALLVLVVCGGLLLQVLTQTLSMINVQVQVDTGQRLVYALRARLLGHLQALALRHHVVTRTADSVYRMEADAYCVHDLVMSGLLNLFVSVLTLTAMFLILLRLDASLALLSLAVVPLLYACLRYYSTRMVNRAQQVKELESRLVDRVYEILSGIKVVKSFAREPHELERFEDVGRETMSARLRYTWQESLFTWVVGAITLSGTAVVLAVGGLHVLQGSLTVGGLLVVIAYLASVYGPLSSIAYTTGKLQNAVASSRRVREVLALVPEMLDRADAIDASSIAGEIRFEHVSFAYDEGRPVLHDVSFTARPGEMVALVGLTGAGKSTLASLVPRFYEPQQGHVLIDGVDVAQYQLRGLRQRIAIVLQDPMLFGTTVAENLRYGRLDATMEDVHDAARAAHAHEFITKLPRGYDTRLAEAGGSLSGGERQRLSIARALLKDAPILILDEPTSSLDAISEAAVFDAFRRLRQGRTTLVIAHRLSTVQDADRILVLHEGRISAQGTHSELLSSNQLYRRMCARLSIGKSMDDRDAADALEPAI